MKKSELRKLIKEEVRLVLTEATNAYIGVEMPQGVTTTVYLHFDGHPEHAGKILKTHYKDRTKIFNLLRLGTFGISILGPELGRKQDFDNPERSRGSSLFYGRDRGEKHNTKHTDMTKDGVPSNKHTYIYSISEKKWYYRKPSSHEYKEL